jgi:hypothetical protein
MVTKPFAGLAEVLAAALPFAGSAFSIGTRKRQLRADPRNPIFSFLRLPGSAGSHSTPDAIGTAPIRALMRDRFH